MARSYTYRIYSTKNYYSIHFKVIYDLDVGKKRVTAYEVGFTIAIGKCINFGT